MRNSITNSEKNPAKKIVAAALTTAMVGCALPAASFAINDNDENAGIPSSIQAAVDVSVEDFITADIDEVNELPKKFQDKWIILVDSNGDLVNDQSVRIRYTLTGSKLDHIDVAGSGNIAKFPVFADSYIYNSAHVAKEVTVYIGKNITSVGNDWGGKTFYQNVSVTFEKGSNLTRIGEGALEGAGKVDLSNCKKLTAIERNGLSNVKSTVTLPASVTRIDKCALIDTKVKLANPEKTTLPANAQYYSTRKGVITVPAISSVKVKLANPNKVKVTWTKPGLLTGQYKNKVKPVSYAVRYKVQYRVKGDIAWKKTGFVKSKSKILTMLQKGAKYQVRVTAYKKSNGKWKAITTSAYKTTAAVKGYNPKPALTAAETSVKATWAKVPGANKYKVYWKAEGSPSWKSKTVKSRSFTVKGLEPGKAVQVTVAAYKGKKGICKSTAAKATTKQAQVAPPAEQPEAPTETPAQ